MLGDCNFQANYDRLIRFIRQTTTDGLITLIIISSIGRSLLAAGVTHYDNDSAERHITMT